MDHNTLLILLTIIAGFVMAWGVGANDVGNAMGTSVGAKVLTIKQAIIVAAIFEAAGAIFASGHVTETIRGKIINVHMLAGSPELLVYGMLASLLAAGIWLVAATFLSWPVSATHSIVGAIIGFAVVGIGVNAVAWHVVINIVMSWLVTPVISGIIAYLLFMSVHKLILDIDMPIRNAKRYVPCYIFLVAFIVSSVTLPNFPHSVMIALLISAAVTVVGISLMRRIKMDPNDHRKLVSAKIEKIFGILTVFTACALAFAHGSNDIANAIGPLAAVISIIKYNDILATSVVPFWIPLFGAAGMLTGLIMLGYKIMSTIGSNITQLTPSRAFAAQLATASTVVIASGLGLPISTTQTLVGAVLGVGFARGIGALNLQVVGNILVSWVITLPIGAGTSIVLFYLIKWAFNH